MTRSKELSALLSPWLFILCAVIPQVILATGGWTIFSLVQSNLQPQQVEAWVILSASLVSGCLVTAYFTFCAIVCRRPLEWYFFPLYVAAYAAWIFLYCAYLDSLIPWSTPRWVIAPEEFVLAPVSLIMPSIFYGVLVCVYRLTPAGSRGWQSLLGAVGIAFGWYAFFHWILPARRGFLDSSTAHYVTFTLFAVSAVVFILLLLRWMVVLSRKPSTVWQFILSFLFALVLPLLGLYLDSAMPYIGKSPIPFKYGDFSHPCFALLALVNAFFLLLPVPDKPATSYLQFCARCACLAFTTYFFLAFAPLIPLALVVTLAAGLGLLILTPSILFLLHICTVAQHAVSLSKSYSGRSLFLSAVVSFAILPLTVCGLFYRDRVILESALRSMREPNYESELVSNIDIDRLEAVVARTQRYKERQQRFPLEATPLLDPIYQKIVFGNQTVSDSTLVDLVSYFELRAHPVVAATPVNLPKAKLANVSAHRINSDSGPATKATLVFESSTTGNQEQEYVGEFKLPAGVIVSDFTLRIGNDDVPGQLVEKNAALWIYQQITNQRRDPGLLYHVSSDTLQLRVFPVLATLPRTVTITFLHTEEAEPVTIDGHRVVLDTGLRSSVGSVSSTSGAMAHIPARVVSDLPKIQRSPYYHFIVECEQDSNTWQAGRISEFLSKYRTMRDDSPVISIGSRTFATASIDGSTRLSTISSCTRNGTFDLDYALKSMFLRSGRNHSLTYPVPVVVSRNLEKARKPAKAPQFAALVPEARAMLILDKDVREKVRDFSGNDVLPLSVDQLIAPQSVRAWPSKDEPRAFLRDENIPQEVFLFDSMTDGLQVPDTDWNAGLAMRGEWFRQSYFPNRSTDSQWVDLLRAGIERRILSPATSFIVLETELQRETLRRKNEARIHGRKIMDAGEMARMDEPSWIYLLAMLTVVAGWRRLRRSQSKAAQN